MIDINDLKSIENYFADNLETPLFPILGELYFKKGDYKRAKKVCDIGLKNNPDSSVGYYILAKIFLIKDDLIKAENFLEKSIKYNLMNLSSMNLLFFIQKELKRSKIKIKKNVLNILSLDPNHNDCNNWINTNYKKDKPDSKNPELQQVNASQLKEKKNSGKKINKTDNKDLQNQIKKSNEILDINSELASMTLFNIYKSQGYYQQALQVLNILKKKENNKTINEEIKILNNLIEESK